MRQQKTVMRDPLVRRGGPNLGGKGGAVGEG